jgi:hypothetical protein
MEIEDPELIELRRKIDHQIETVYQTEEKALGLLRITIAGIGLIITVGSISASTGTLPNIQSQNIEERIIETSNRINTTSDMIAVPQADLITGLVLVIGTLLFTYSLYSLFVKFPISANRVIKHSELQPGADTKTVLSETSEFEFEAERNAYINDYIKTIDENEKKLEKIISDWNDSRKNLRNGMAAFGASIFTLASVLVMQNARMVLLYLLFHIILGVSLMIEKVDIKDVMEFVYFDWYVDGGVILIIVSVLSLITFSPSTLTNQIYLTFYTLSLTAGILLFLYGGVVVQIERTIKSSFRYIVIGVSTFVLLTLVVLGTETLDGLFVPVMSLFTVFLICSSAGVILFIFYIGKKIVSRYESGEYIDTISNQLSNYL